MSKVYTEAEVAAIVAKTKAEANTRVVKVKLNPTGTISVTGVGRWPVSLYKSQWERVLDAETVKHLRAAMAIAPDKA